MRCRLATLALLTLLGQVPVWAAEADRWTAKLDVVDDDLRNGKYGRARAETRALSRQLLNQLGSGEGAAKLLAVTALYRALAEAGLGNQEEAVWYWHAAAALFPAVGEAPLKTYGAAGELLRSHPLRTRPPTPSEAGSPSWTEGPAGSDSLRRIDGPPSEIVPPRRISTPRPDFPDRFWNLRRGGEMSLPALAGPYEGPVIIVQVVVTREGRTRDPILLKGRSEPTFAWATLEAIRTWRFHAATKSGEAIDFEVNLFVSYHSE